MQITLLDETGNQIGQIGRTVPGLSSQKVNQVAAAAGIHTALNIFSVRITTYDAQISAYASVVDNVTGDPVLYTAQRSGNETLYVPGLAHLPGVNESTWRSDITFFNPNGVSIDGRIRYIPSEAEITDRPYMSFTGMNPSRSYFFADVVGFLLGDEIESKGYFVVAGLHGYDAPWVFSRTYNQDETAGSYGQNLMAFGEFDLIHDGESAFVAGVSNSADPLLGFRSNLGLLNVDEEGWARVQIVGYAASGTVVGQLEKYLAPGENLQFNLFNEMGLGAVTATGSVQVTVTDGGPVAAYVSEIDNRTQDPVLLPAVVQSID